MKSLGYVPSVLLMEEFVQKLSPPSGKDMTSKGGTITAPVKLSLQTSLQYLYISRKEMMVNRQETASLDNITYEAIKIVICQDGGTHVRQGQKQALIL